MTRLFVRLGAMLLLYFASAPCSAQAVAPPDQRPPLFAGLFLHPTNNNGYEEFVQAADLIRNIEDVEAATSPGATLDYKRKVVAMTPCAEALRLVREGLTKQVGSPRDNIDENTILPELSMFRKLARLLKTEQYVDFADGRVASAIDSLQVGLAFGYRVQTDSLISGLVGIAICAIVLDEFAAHFDQLSIYQCDSVLGIVNQMLQAENPGIHLLGMEKSDLLKILDGKRADSNALIQLISLGVGPDDIEAATRIQSIASHLASNPGELGTIVDFAKAKIAAMYDQAALNMQVPLAERKPFVRDNSNMPGAILFRALTVDPQQIIDKYSIDQAKIRLLGVHVLIRRYEWDHNSLPSSLSQLHADKLIMDPFTGSAISYKREVDRYTLTSAGPFKRDDKTNEATAERTPVKLR